jgi:chorismate mutase-like protein
MKRKKRKAKPAVHTGPAAAAGAGLGNIRDSIDAIDARIHALLNERARCAQLVGISKSAAGRAVDYYRPEREAEVLRLALRRNRGPLRDDEIVRLFREIMSACLAQHEPLKVAFLGPEGAFSQSAVLKHFGASVRALPLAAIDEIFHQVEDGAADFGVVPMEHHGAGTALEMFLTSGLKICGEVELRGARLLVVGRKLLNPSGADRTTVLMSSADTDDPGALFQLLEPLAEHGVNMTRIESRLTRPSRLRKCDHVFFIDIEGHMSEPKVAKALAALQARASLFKILGSYPQAVL